MSATHESGAGADWRFPFREFLVHLEGHRAPKTVRFYKVQITQLIEWAEEERIPFDRFGKRDLDRFLALRRRTVKPTTLQHDAVCAKAWLKWCVRNDLLDRSPLSDYAVRAAPRPPRYMPTPEDAASLVQACTDFWDPRKNRDGVKYHTPARRAFHRDRNLAILLLLIDTAMRAGEALSLKVEDYRSRERQATVREAKGRAPRVLPLSARTVDAIDGWLKVRERVMEGAPDGDDGWLFISETGGKVEPDRLLKAVKCYMEFAGIKAPITLHSLRRFSLNKVAKSNLLAAQQLAGHKSPLTTVGYTALDADFVREEHAKAGALASIFLERGKKRSRLV